MSAYAVVESLIVAGTVTVSAGVVWRKIAPQSLAAVRAALGRWLAHTKAPRWLIAMVAGAGAPAASGCEVCDDCVACAKPPAPGRSAPLHFHPPRPD